MYDFVPCLDPPPIPTEDGRLNPSSVLLDDRAYISAAAASNATAAAAFMSTGNPVHVSFVLARAPRLSYFVVHFPGPVAGPNVGTLSGPTAGTAAVRCVREAPHVISTHAELALVRVPTPGARNINEDYDYFVYVAAHPQQPSMRLLPKPHFRFQDNEAAIFPAGSHHHGCCFVVACLKNTINSDEFNFQRYDSSMNVWSSRLLRVDAPQRNVVLPIPDTVIFHDTTKVITLDGGTVGWVDLWKGILFCDVLEDDDKLVLRDMPLPKPARSNRLNFCRGCPHRYRDITVLACRDHDIKIKYVEMETRPGDVPSSSRQHPVDNSASSDSDSYSDDDEGVAYYWKANIWTMSLPISSWKDWHKERMVDVTDIVVDNPIHSELLLPLPRHNADPKEAKWSLRRLITAHPALGLGMDGDVIYFLSKVVDVRDNKGWVIAVNTRDKKLSGVGELDHKKNSCFRRYYLPSEISKHLIKPPAGKLNLMAAKLCEESKDDWVMN